MQLENKIKAAKFKITSLIESASCVEGNFTRTTNILKSLETYLEEVETLFTELNNIEFEKNNPEETLQQIIETQIKYKLDIEDEIAKIKDKLP